MTYSGCELYNGGYKERFVRLMFRERKRKDTHDVIVRKYRCWFADEDTDFRLPNVVYEVVKRMQVTWTDIAVHNNQAWEAFRKDHPAPAKAPRAFYTELREYATKRIESEQLPDELGQTLADRLQTTFKMMARGGGAPRPRYRLERFSLHHRFTAGGLDASRIGSERAKRFKIVLPPADAYQQRDGLRNPRAQRRQRIVPAWIRINDETVPLNVLLHRPLPETKDVFLKRVALVGSKAGLVMPWELYLTFTCEVPCVRPATIPSTRCGIDVGWRKLDDERMRVAVLYDGSRHEELVLPLRIKDRRLGEISLERLDNIKHCRDVLLERTKKAVAEKLGSIPAGWALVRNGGLMRMLKDTTNPDVLNLLQAWKRDNDHYLMLEAKVRGRLARHRDALYRNWAKNVAERYGIIRIEAMNQREMWNSEATKANPALRAAAQRRGLAACGLLVSYVKHAIAKARGVVEMVPASHTTDVCADCGGMFEAREAIIGRCQRGHQKDQDWNAAENIYGKEPEVVPA